MGSLCNKNRMAFLFKEEETKRHEEEVNFSRRSPSSMFF